MWTRKDFVTIAKTLNSIQPYEPHETGARYYQWLETVKVFADACAASNPLFDRKKFLRACGGKDV